MRYRVLATIVREEGSRSQEIRRGRVTPMSEIFSVAASISENRHLSWFTKILAKDVPIQILIGWTRAS
jgi:hypothetical protein